MCYITRLTRFIESPMRGTVLALLLLLLSAGCSGQSGSDGQSGQVMIQPTESVLAAATLSETATLDIVGTPLTGIRMNRNSITNKFEATVAGVPVGTWKFRVTYRDKDKKVTAKAEGDGTVTANTITIVSLTTLTFPAINVAAGSNHNCARLTDKTMKCWGANGFGQLGNGTTTRFSSPVEVLKRDGPSLTGVTDVAAGGSHSCAVLNGGPTGTVKCWGDNSFGQLGNGTTINSSSPVEVLTKHDGSPLTGVTAVAAGRAHSCAVLNGGPTGTVRCWGYNNSGRLGDGTTTRRLTPVKVEGITTATAVATGSDHSCARLTKKTVWCWGANGSGRLGDDTSTRRLTPVEVEGSKPRPPSPQAGLTAARD